MDSSESTYNVDIIFYQELMNSAHMLLFLYTHRVVNAPCMSMRVMVVCLSVCFFSQSTDFLRGLYNKMNIPDDFMLISVFN